MTRACRECGQSFEPFDEHQFVCDKCEEEIAQAEEEENEANTGEAY